MSAHTPGPWRWTEEFRDESGNPTWTLIGTGDGLYGILTCATDSSPQDLNDEANARLIAAAPDHALVARVLAAGDARWYPWEDRVSGELSIGGLLYATKLDEFGVPKLHDVLRAALACVNGIKPLTEAQQAQEANLRG